MNFIDNLTWQRQNSEKDWHEDTHKDGQRPKEVVEIILGHVGPKIVDEAEYLAQAKNSEGLKEQYIILPNMAGALKNALINLSLEAAAYVSIRL